MSYPKIPDFKKLTEQIELYAQIKSEYGSTGISTILSKTEKDLRAALTQIKRLPIDRGKVVWFVKTQDVFL